MNRSPHEEKRQILGRVKREEFVGRDAELRAIVSHSTLKANSGEPRGLLLLLAPLTGVSELLRQAYDELFNRREEVVPIYFALPQAETTAVSAAIEFLNTFLRQYIAFRRNEPSLCQAALTLNDLAELAPPADVVWIGQLIENYHRQRFSNDDTEFVRFCLTAPSRVRSKNASSFIIFDASQLANFTDSSVPLATEVVRSLALSNSPFAVAGLRRDIRDTVSRAGVYADSFDVFRVDPLPEEHSRTVVTTAARRLNVAINDETRDLLVQQLEGSPFFITAILQAAREKHLSLDSYLACERLYVDELLGGRLNRYFTSVLERVAPEPETRSALVRLLCESLPAGSRTASLEAWRRRLNLETGGAESLIRALHIQELVNWDGETVDPDGGPTAWKDFLRSRFRLDALREPRALVVADLMSASLRRAPQTIARHYRRAASFRLRELLGKFDAQRMPRTLFDYDIFAKAYKGATVEEITAGLDADWEMLRLPQVFHTATGASFSPELEQFGEDNSVVAHAFEDATYSDEKEIVWLVAKVDSKLEAEGELTEVWLDRLDCLARKSGFVRSQIWLVSNEGFSTEANDLLRKRNAYSSSQQQFEILTARLGEGDAPLQSGVHSDEVELILPMGADYEVLAATTVEQLARRINFRPEAINQIKTAIVEACINASEHSLSPDRKIYQRFRVEDDKLVITIASRGILPFNIGDQNGEQVRRLDTDDIGDQRRGWGIKLIKTLMDEVEFERVDEGTRLRMTKYLRS